VDLGAVLVVALVVLAPVALVLIVGMLRGYTITLGMRKGGRRRDDDQDGDNGGPG
jgi:hypothetical protein